MFGIGKYLRGPKRVLVGAGAVALLAGSGALAVQTTAKGDHHIVVNLTGDHVIRQVSGDFDEMTWKIPNDHTAGQWHPTVKDWPISFPQKDSNQSYKFSVIVEVCRTANMLNCDASKTLKEGNLDFVIWHSPKADSDTQDPCYPTSGGGQICFP